MPDFHVQRFICAACLDPAFLKRLCIEKLMTANCSAECPTQLQRIFTTHATFIVYFRSCSMTTSLANDFAVVRLETKEGPFCYRNISGEEFIFYYSFK